MQTTVEAEIALGGAPRARWERARVVARLLRHWTLLLLGLLVAPRAASRHRGPQRLLALQAYSVHLAQFFETLVVELRDQGDVALELVILPHPHLPVRSERELRIYARERLGFRDDQILPFWRTLWRRYDAMVCADVYARFPLRRGLRRILLRHGPGVNRRHVTRRPFRKTVFDFDLALVAGEHDREVLSAAASERATTRIIASGQPFLDRLGESAIGRADYLGDLGLDPRLPTVLFAPSWSGLRELPERGVPYWNAVVEALLRLDANVIVKLHDCSYHPSMAGGIDWRAKLAAVAASRLAIDGAVDDVPALEHVDVLVTDVSSRAFNFMLLDKPVVLWHPTEHSAGPWERRREQLLRRGSLVARSIDEVSGLVSGALAGTRSAPDARAVSAACFANAGRATAAVVDCLRAEVELPQLRREARRARAVAAAVVADVAARRA